MGEGDSSQNSPPPPPPPPPPSPPLVHNAVPLSTVPPPLVTFQLKISEKLDEKIFLVWRQQIKPVVNIHNLQSFLYYAEIPDEFIRILSRTLSLKILRIAHGFSKISGCYHGFSLRSQVLL